MIYRKNLYRGCKNDGQNGFFASFDKEQQLTRIEFRKNKKTEVWFELNVREKTGTLRTERSGETFKYEAGKASLSTDDRGPFEGSYREYSAEFQSWCQEQLNRFYEYASPLKCVSCHRTASESLPFYSDDLSIYFLCKDCANYFNDGVKAQDSNFMKQRPIPKQIQVGFLFDPQCDEVLNCPFCNKAIKGAFLHLQGQESNMGICKICLKKASA